MYEALKLKYWWPKMQQQVNDYIDPVIDVKE
jgi:hypothetical protein